MRRAPQFPPHKTDFIPFAGGYDTDTPPLLVKAGTVRRAQNYEIAINGGYKRLTGYERIDGRTKPSDAAYAVLNATITGAYVVGNTLTGLTSGATGVIAAATATYFVITKAVGTFQAAESLQIGGVTIATAGGAAVTDGATTAKLHAQYKNAAADIYRADITAVPGSGNVLGVVLYNDVWYAWRNNAGGTAAAIYKSSTSGWTSVPLGEEVAFTAGNSSVNDGDTLTQGAVTATIKRVVDSSGTSPNIAGKLVIHGRAGGNFAAGAATSTGGGALTLSGAQTAITIQPGGRYGFVIENFGGATGTKRVYGADGANRGFEFDGSDYGYVPITTGMTTDTPTHVYAHKKQLFFSFASSAQHSGPGTPFRWTPVSGAAELAMGDTITGFMGQAGSEATAGGALAITTRNHIGILYGNDSTDWNLTSFSDESGAYPYSLGRVGSVNLFMDDIGLSTLTTTANYGNFASASISQHIQKWLKTRRTQVQAACVSRDASQYRLFFSDDTALYVTLKGNKVLGMMPQYITDSIKCVWSGELASGAEAICFGSDNGYVYQMERGTSFDGAAIEAFMYLAFNPSKSARQLKHYQRGAFEVSGDGYAEFSFTYELGYASTEISQPGSQSDSIDFTPANWDVATWDSFIWDGVALAPSSFDMPGDAENVSLILSSNNDYFQPVTFSGAFIDYIMRRRLKI